MKLSACTHFAIALATGLSVAQQANAQQQIVHTYVTTRSMAMGGTRITTGLYDDNFFGNPARVTENPRVKVSLIEFMLEASTPAIGQVSDLLSAEGDALSNVASSSGENNHVRIQTSFPSFYLPNYGTLAYAFGLLTSTQVDTNVRRSYQVAPRMITDVGPAFTIGRRFLEGDALSVGMTVHATYRVASDEGFTFIDLIQGKELSPMATGGDGGLVDGSIGLYYKIPKSYENFALSAGFSVNNVMGGEYKLFSAGLSESGNAPVAQNRAYNFGVAARRATWWKLTDTVFALEFTDIGNNPGGSFFRTIHIGGETRYKVVSTRLGFNQGYITAGFGFDFRTVSIDVVTYGEELSLNAGGLQDRRYAFKFALQI